MLTQLRPALVMMLMLTVITGIIYPLSVTGLARVFFPHQANGSLLRHDGRVIGSELIGQRFVGPQYFHPRPSTAGKDGYGGMSSGGSNLGPTSRVLVERVADATEALRRDNPHTPIPVDLVTSSASGLDPHLTPAAAVFQVPRIARARQLPEDLLHDLIRQLAEGRQLGLLGEPRVNVLRLNLTLDSLSHTH